jgi:hypothetical protein
MDVDLNSEIPSHAHCQTLWGDRRFMEFGCHIWIPGLLSLRLHLDEHDSGMVLHCKASSFALTFLPFYVATAAIPYYIMISQALSFFPMSSVSVGFSKSYEGRLAAFSHILGSCLPRGS